VPHRICLFASAVIAVALLVGPGSAAVPGQIAVVAVDFTEPHVTGRLATYSASGRALSTLVRTSSGSSGSPVLRRVDAPVWAADGARLYFIGVGARRQGDRFGYSDTDVYELDASSRRVTRLTRTRDVAAAVPSPDGTSFALARVEHPGRRPFTVGLWTMRGDGGGMRRLLPARPGWSDAPGSWSPDGTRLALTRCPPFVYREDGLWTGRCTVYELDLGTRRLRKLAARATDPAYSPDGRSLVFLSDRDENGTYSTGSDEVAYARELYVATADGSGARRLTDTFELDERSPTWSPDGGSIAYARRGPGRGVSQLMVVDAGGADARLLAGDASSSPSPGSPSSLDEPAWRP
jgi:Tol biopolymer transport system component